MKTKDVVIGGEYMTRVSGELVRVKVVRATTIEGRRTVYGRARDRVAFVVQRTSGPAMPLPKPRTAGALHPLPAWST